MNPRENNIVLTEHEREEMIKKKQGSHHNGNYNNLIDERKRASKSRRKRYRMIKKFFGISIAINVALIVILAYLAVTLIRENDESLGICEGNDNENTALNDNSVHRLDCIFCDLSLEEVRDVLKYLYTRTSLNLLTPEKANLSSTFIYSIELLLPPKHDVRIYLDNIGAKPLREAKVVIFNGGSANRSVDEYIVGPLGDFARMRLRRNPLSTSVSYRVRQVTFAEVWGVYQLILTTPGLHNVLKESYGATLFDCIEQGTQKCLVAHKTNLPISYSAKRKTWISFYYDLEYFTLHPLDFQFLVDTDSVDPLKWKIEKVWYSNRSYGSYKDFMQGYKNKSIPRTRRHFPSVKSDREDTYGSLHRRSGDQAETPKRAPKQFEPDGRRFHISGQSVRYLNWHFTWHNSLMRGPTLFNINYNKESIVYELGLQDIIVLYTGNSPALSRASFADGLNSLSSRAAGLVPGVDCPEHALFYNITITTEDFPMGGIIPNAICIFEHNLGVPLRRHHSSIPGQGGLFYGSLSSAALIFRTIFVVNNYDYILDYIFYESGALQVKVYSTGYLLTSFPFPDEADFGFQVGANASAPVHLHLFNFKIDLDILGSKNRYKTINVEVEKIKSSKAGGRQFKLKYDLKRSELKAAYHYNISSPKYHVFYNNEKLNKYGHPRGYQIESKSYVQQLLPQDVGFEDTISWSRYQMAVTKRKETEVSSSSIHATFDAGDPVVDFSSFVQDDENIVDKDIVAWLTLGTYHIPHTEDVPNVVTAGKELSFLLSPFNFFTEDPSIGSPDSVRITPKDSSSARKGLNIEGNLEKYNCMPKRYDYDLLKSDGSSIFYSFT